MIALLDNKQFALHAGDCAAWVGRGFLDRRKVLRSTFLVAHADGTLPGTEAVMIVTAWLAEAGHPLPPDECDETPDEATDPEDTPHGE